VHQPRSLAIDQRAHCRPARLVLHPNFRKLGATDLREAHVKFARVGNFIQNFIDFQFHERSLAESGNTT